MVAPVPRVLGSLVVLDEDGNPTKKSRKISTRHHLIIGRDANRCQWVFQDPHMSQQHLRIYVVMTPDDRPDFEPLIYAEDISRNGVYWNGSLIGKKSSAFLLSDGDRLRLTSKTSLRFESSSSTDFQHFSVVQEREMREFCAKYVVTDRLLDATANTRKFMAIEQRSRTQVACEVITLDRPIRRYRYSSSLKRPRSADDLGFQHELQAVKSWINDRHSRTLTEKKLDRCFRISKLVHSINHPNLLDSEQILVTDNTIYIFQELVPAGNLLAYVDFKKGALLEIEAAIAIRQILHAVQALHEEHVVHRNIRPTTVLVSTLSAAPRFVLSSFELSRKILPYTRTRSGTRIATVSDLTVSKYFSANEVDAEAEDVRSVGAIAAFLLTGSDRLFSSSPAPRATGEAVCQPNLLVTIPKTRGLRSEAIDFLKRLVETSLQTRLSAQAALDHIWFSTQTGSVQHLCEKAVQHWRPALLKDPFIDFVKGFSHEVEDYACSRRIREEDMPFKGRSLKKSVEPSYKPFYKEVFHMANAGNKAVRMSRWEASAKLREMSAEWTRGISSSPSPSRNPSPRSHSADDSGSIRRFTEYEAKHVNQSTIVARPKLMKQLSYRHPKLDTSLRLAEAKRFPESPCYSDTSSMSVPTSPSTHISSRGARKFPVFEEEIVLNTSNYAEARTKQIFATDQHETSRAQQSASTWALNVRSESKLNASTPSRTRHVPVTPKSRDRRSVFALVDDESDEQVLTTFTPVTRSGFSQEGSNGSGVTPHMAHLRLA